jgi:acyl-CoA thioesterase-2
MESPRPGMEARVRPPQHQVWMRSHNALGDDLKFHQAALAYSSDFPMLPTMVQPHAIRWNTPGFQRASLDHAIWFHRPFDFHNWHLYDLDSPTVAHTRGFSRSTIYAEDGTLVASVTQEAMIRVRPTK